MNRTVIGLYDSLSEANNAIEALLEEGFTRQEIGLVAGDIRGEYRDVLEEGLDEEQAESSSEGVGVGAGIGAVLGGLGGLLIGLSAALIPGIGPVLAAGPLAAALGGLAGAGVGALAGGVAGGLLGVLGSMGVPEERARLYTEAVRRGGVLVTVHAEDYTLAEQARDILQAQGAIDIKERVAEWQKTGWNESDRHKPDWQETSSLEGFSDDIFVPYDMNELAEEETSSRVSGTSPLEDRLSDETATEEADEVIQEPVEEDEAGTSHYYAAEYPDDFYRYSHTFREHYRAYLSGSDHDYSFYQPAYYVAYQIFNDGRYRDSDWGEVEPEVRTRWERENPGTWDEFEHIIRTAWQDLKNPG